MSFPLPITPENVGIMTALGFIGNPSPPVPPDPDLPLLSLLSVAPTDATDMHADMIVGQAARFQVRDAGLVTYNVSTAAQAEAVGAVKVMGLFRADGSLALYSTPLDYVTLNGLPYAKNNSGSTYTRPMAASALTAFTGPSGITAMLKYGGLGTTTTAATLLNVSYTASSAKYYISTASDRTITPGARMNTGDAISAAGYGGHIDAGAIEIIGMRIDHVSAKTRYYRYGEVFFEKPSIYGSPGTAMPATAATLAEIRISPGALDGGSLIWASAISDADEAIALKWQKKLAVSGFQISDGIQSWHGCQNMRHSVTGRTLIGFTSSINGTIMGAEFGDDGLMTASKAFVNNTNGYYLTIDDHNELNWLEPGNGGLVAVSVGHGNGVPSNKQDVLEFWYSATGYMDDLVRLGGIEDPKLTIPNYAQRFAKGNTAGFIFNDDFSVMLVPMRHLDNGKNLAGWQSGRPLIRSTTATNSNQIYLRAVPDGPDHLVLWTSQNAINTQVAIRRSRWNHVTGDLEVNGVVVGNTWVDPSITTEIFTHQALPAIYTPPVGKSLRVVDATPTMIAIVQWDEPIATNPEHGFLSYNGSGDINLAINWTYTVVGPTGAGVENTRAYLPSMVFANDPHTGFKAYRQYESGGLWGMQKLEGASPTDVLTATVLIAPNSKKQRTVYSPEGASSAIPWLASECRGYTGYNIAWTSNIRIGTTA